MDGLENLSKLKTLYCHKNQITDLSPIRNSTNLETLYCDHNQITSLKAIEYLPDLINIFCFNNKITSLKGIETLPKLEVIEFDHNPLPQEVKLMKYNLEELKEYYKYED